MIQVGILNLLSSVPFKMESEETILQFVTGFSVLHSEDLALLLRELAESDYIKTT